MILLKKLGIDTSKTYVDLSSAKDVLNRHTHIEERTFSLSKKEIYLLSE